MVLHLNSTDADCLIADLSEGIFSDVNFRGHTDNYNTTSRCSQRELGALTAKQAVPNAIDMLLST